MTDEEPLMTQEQMDAMGLDSRGLVPFMTLVLLFGAAVNGATRKERQGLYDARLLLRKGAPLQEVGRAIFDAKGPEWEVPEATMAAITALNEETP